MMNSPLNAESSYPELKASVVETHGLIGAGSTLLDSLMHSSLEKVALEMGNRPTLSKLYINMSEKLAQVKEVDSTANPVVNAAKASLHTLKVLLACQSSPLATKLDTHCRGIACVLHSLGETRPTIHIQIHTIHICSYFIIISDQISAIAVSNFETETDK